MDGIASNPDDPDAPLADRLLLALGMWPQYVEQLGVDEVLAAAVEFRSRAHLFPMAAEDYGTAAAEREDLRSRLIAAEGVVSAAERVMASQVPAGVLEERSVDVRSIDSLRDALAAYISTINQED